MTNKNSISYLTTTLAAVFILSACLDTRDDKEVSEPPVVDSSVTSDSFLKFINTQASLAPGNYSIVAATVNNSENGSYTLSITYDDDTVETINGRWGNSGGLDHTNENNPKHEISLASSGGINVVLTSSVDNYLYITRNNHIIAKDDNSAGNGNAQIVLENSKINSALYAQAYYTAIDPNDQRTTLADFKSLNGFNDGSVKKITIRDKLDLGYGRNMYVKSLSNNGFAFYVDNYLVQLTPGDVSTYSALGLDAAIAEDRNFHISTNAIEFSPIDSNDPSSDNVLKFFTFSTKDKDGEQHRQLSIDMDGRGEKFMPTVCFSCHGGNLSPLNPDGSFPEQSLRSGKFNILDINHFTFKNIAGFTESDLQPNIKSMNQLIHSSYNSMNNLAETSKGKWNGAFALELGNGAYGGDFSGADYNRDYIPTGWQHNDKRPEGVERLYLEVVKPHCIGCHALQGNNSGETITTLVNGEEIALANAINFSSYEKFISYNDEIIELVYRRGNMPLSLLNYSTFWQFPDAAPTLLASFLSDFDAFDNNGGISEPKLPVPIIENKRTSNSPVTLNASGSYLADKFNWSIVSSPNGATASLSVNDGINTVLTADIQGDYLIELTATNSANLRASKIVTVTIDNTLPRSPQQLTFVDDILPILETSCVSCHAPNKENYAGIPVYYDQTNITLYQDVLQSIDFNDPESSQFLLKPTQLQHGGGININRNNTNDERDYQTILNWISHAAPCGSDNKLCQ